MSENVAEWRLLHQKTPGCCGMEFHHFYPSSTLENGVVSPNKEPFSYAWFLKHVKIPTESKNNYNKTPYMLKALILFSATENQKGQPHSTYALVQWLKSIGEQITESPWVTNYSTYKIQCYIWSPSPKFREELHKAYEAKYGKTAVPTMLHQAVCNHDWIV